MKTQNRSKLNRTIILVVVWLVSVFVTGRCIWQLRSRQYRSYAEQSLKDVVVSGISLISPLTDHSEQTDEAQLEQIAYQFYRIDAIRQVLRNIYVKDNPGQLSVPPSVWSRCGNAVHELEKSDESKTEGSFLKDINALCKEWTAVFAENQGTENFEYQLSQLEESLQKILEKNGLNQ